MVRILFELSPMVRATLGPLVRFRLSGNFIRDDVTRQPLAQFKNHFWHAEGHCFTRFDCDVPVALWFEDYEGGKSEPLGPHAQVNCTDGTMRAGQVLVAKFIEETQLWHAIELENYWPVLVIAADNLIV